MLNYGENHQGAVDEETTRARMSSSSLLCMLQSRIRDTMFKYALLIGSVMFLDQTPIFDWLCAYSEDQRTNTIRINFQKDIGLCLQNL